VRAVDAVEHSRDFEPPVFVDVRIRREVRAKGFVGNAFCSLVGEGRYKWMPDLGNRSIVTGASGIAIANPSAANDLLDMAIKLMEQKRRLIFYCSCEFPHSEEVGACHRTTVATLVLTYARKRRIPVQIVEWPGGNPEMIDVEVSDEDFQKLRRGKKSIPLSMIEPLPRFSGLPWGSIARVHTPAGNELLIATGPAKCWKDGQWYLPVPWETGALGDSRIELERKAKTWRQKLGFEPQSA
jgi:hypothetical protein